MPPWSVAVDSATLRDLYVDRRLTTDEIARRLGCGAATVRRGLKRFGIPVRRRGPDAIRPKRVPARLPISWHPDLAWIVGLIASDGNLSRKPSRICIVSKDVDLLETVRRCLALEAPIRRHLGGFGHLSHHLAWSNSSLYDWLLDIGLTPAKSLTLGPLNVPDRYFVDFLRGCIDGDGSVLTYIDRYHTATNERYVYERLYVSLNSASAAFLDWVLARLRRLLPVRGSIQVKRRTDHRPMYRLRFAKADSIRILRRMYYSPDVPCLTRKRITAERFLSAPTLGILSAGGVSELEDDTDSKSVARKGVGVQVPSPLPTPILDTSRPAPVP